jgi:hypothetical protein
LTAIRSIGSDHAVADVTLVCPSPIFHHRVNSTFGFADGYVEMILQAVVPILIFVVHLGVTLELASMIS